MKLNDSNHDCRGVEPAVLKSWLHDGKEIALLDVREHGLYGEAHLFYSVNVPYSRLEIEALRLVPGKATRIVLYAEDAEASRKAAAVLAGLGYANAHVLDGGIEAWRRQGYAVFAGVNLPSKTFGELAEHQYHTPAISAQELNRRIAEGEKLVVLDGRPFPEFQKMSIPTAICCPNGELALRVRDLVPDEKTPIVINCAGRTRSIIGAQTLINLGVPNPVYALENGTQGWYLNGYTLEQGQTRRHGFDTTEENLAAARERAAKLARRLGIAGIDVEAYRGLANEDGRNTFLFDVCTPEEYKTGTFPGARHAAGGQLIQATDQFVGVRGARLVLLDRDGVRAPVVASWLAQLGWDVCLLDAGNGALDAAPAAAPAVPGTLPRIDSIRVRELRDGGALLVDIRPSMDYRKQHIAGAGWSIRKLATDVVPDDGQDIVLLADDANVAELYARDMRLPQGTRVHVCLDGAKAWQEAGLPLASTPDHPPNSECIDFLFFVHDRHEGNREAAQRYLDWETNLVNQIDEQERAAYRFLS
jgi:rhodanese-related sulfurtransferase